MIGDSNLKIRDIVARWPGSQHDNTIFNHSRIKSRLENGDFQNCILFPALAYGIRLHIETVLNVIVATSVLHNIARDMHENEPPAEINNDELDYLIAMGDIPDQLIHNNNQAVIFRNEIVNYFENMA
ncbi:hypothetical protein RN001_014645 [Aquatica leii]|uniref:Uncharacterized protein n=1 Tax=Aquatica leii TaxID=1421715 RepID=A0AAN7P270_9COLE|nr:hypothetical protein RN001_014645 [Aquatica leii]